MSEKWTAGPWEWMGSDLGGLYLATTHSGRRYVMGFKRRGMQHAEPMFQVDGRMVPASEMVAFDVGDGTARGFNAAKADPTVYRYDVAFIDHPDARLIAAAPAMAEALADLVDKYRHEVESHAEDVGITFGDITLDEALAPALVALASARGDTDGAS